MIVFIYLAFLWSLFPLKETVSRSSKEPVRFMIFREVFYGKQRALLFYVFRNLFFAVTCYIVFADNFIYFSYIVISYWVLGTILPGLLLLISFWEIPIQKSGDSNNHKYIEKIASVTFVLISIIWVLGFYGYTKFIFNELPGLIYGLKIPILILVITYIVEKIIDLDINLNSGPISSLAEIRSKLVLNEMEYPEATNEVRVILLGYEAGEVFKKDFDELLKYLRQIRGAHVELKKLMGRINKHFSVPETERSEKEEIVITADMEKMRTQMGEVAVHMKTFKKRYQFLAVKLGILKNFGYDATLYKDQDEALNDILDAIQKDLNNITKKIKKVEENLARDGRWRGAGDAASYLPS